jgi:hypothetical protein
MDYWVLQKSSAGYDFAIGPFGERHLAERYTDQVMNLPAGTELEVLSERFLPDDIRQKLTIRDEDSHGRG